MLGMNEDRTIQAETTKNFSKNLKNIYHPSTEKKLL